MNISSENILGVDDIPALRIILRVGDTVNEARDACRLIELFKEKSVPVALVDILIPGMNGIALTGFV